MIQVNFDGGPRIYFYWGSGSTEPGDPYLYRFSDIYSNVSVFHIFCPDLLGRYFNACNAIDIQNRMRRSDQAFDKY